MTKALVGVAHRTLPCGTKVTLFYHGHTLRAPVVDRGPYANGASWDLTAATAQQLGFTATDRVGVLVPRVRR
jgi:rare lipoprotein A (peptidoglycan hydrolase)